jgi:hypothetical protein
MRVLLSAVLFVVLVGFANAQQPYYNPPMGPVQQTPPPMVQQNIVPPQPMPYPPVIQPQSTLPTPIVPQTQQGWDSGFRETWTHEWRPLNRQADYDTPRYNDFNYNSNTGCYQRPLSYAQPQQYCVPQQPYYYVQPQQQYYTYPQQGTYIPQGYHQNVFGGVSRNWWE